MGEIVNLRRFRKARKRAEVAAEADQARLNFGRSMGERQATGRERDLQDARLEGHRRDRPAPGEPRD